jgi:hypothetical protein
MAAMMAADATFEDPVFRLQWEDVDGLLGRARDSAAHDRASRERAGTVEGRRCLSRATAAGVNVVVSETRSRGSIHGRWI